MYIYIYYLRLSNASVDDAFLDNKIVIIIIIIIITSFGWGMNYISCKFTLKMAISILMTRESKKRQETPCHRSKMNQKSWQVFEGGHMSIVTLASVYSPNQ